LPTQTAKTHEAAKPRYEGKTKMMEGALDLDGQVEVDVPQLIDGETLANIEDLDAKDPSSAIEVYEQAVLQLHCLPDVFAPLKPDVQRISLFVKRDVHGLAAQAEFFKRHLLERGFIAKALQGIKDFNPRELAVSVIVYGDALSEVFRRYLRFLKAYVEGIYLRIIRNAHRAPSTIVPDRFSNFFFSGPSVNQLLFGMLTQPYRLHAFHSTHSGTEKQLTHANT